MANNNPLKKRPSERKPLQIEKARRKAEKQAREKASPTPATDRERTQEP